MRFSAFLCVSAVITIVTCAAVACTTADAPAQPTITPLATFSPRPTPNPNSPTTAPTPAPDSARVVTQSAASRRAVALTFDASTDAGHTAEILRILREHNIRATFALTGVWAERHRDLLFAITADGHQVINNTYSHSSFTGASTNKPPLTAEQRAVELSRTEVTVYRYTSQTTKPYFRPPYGDYDGTVLRDAAADGYDTIIMGTVDTLGWNGASIDDITASAIAAAQPGAIIAMTTTTTSQDAAALEPIIEALQADDYAFETITEILQD